MSLAAKLISAALAAGAVLAVGACAKKISDDLTPHSPPDVNETLISETDAKIDLISNPSTGYSWSYKIVDNKILKETKNEYEGKSALQGASGVRHFDFAALSDGTTEIEFDYSRRGSSPQKTITYTVEVKNKKIIRCDAAGDLDMIYKH